MDEYDIPKRVPPPPVAQPPGYQPPGYQPPGYQPYPSYPAYPPPYAAGGPPTAPLPAVPPAPPSAARAAHPSRPSSPRGSRPAANSRGVASAFLTTIGCLAGSLALIAFVVSTILVNPDRPGQIVKAVLSSSAGRAVVTDAVATTLRTADPTLTPAQASADAKVIVASPSLPSSLGSSKGDVSTALLAQLKQVDPAAAAAIASKQSTGSAGPLSALPGGVLSAENHAHSLLHTGALYLLVIAIIAVGAALLIGPRRDRVLVRVGYWALGASLVQLLIWLALPRALGHFSNSWAQVGAAALRAGGTGLVTVFITLAVGGAAAIAIGYTARTAHRFAG
jgi:hypothetical protein